MRQSLALVAPALFASGCSLIYNPNNIDKPPADATDAPMIDAPMTADARIDAPPLADANPAVMVVEDAAPTVIYEGQGVDNSPPAILVIKGHHFIAGATVSLSPATGLTVGTPMISMNGDYIMVPVTAAVDTSMSTTAVPLTITVDEQGATPQMLANKVSLQPLPHLAGSTLTLPLAPRYSRVALNANPTITGTGPVIIRSMSSITCGNGTGALNAKGGNASGTTGGSAGPGGCAGGDEAAPGGCLGVIGGGGAAGSSGGGGGGGFGTAGAVGGGAANGGPAGPAHGNARVLSYQGTAADGADRNQASGGGGGSTSTPTTGDGGGGGGGGGTIELTAGGDIQCGAIDVTGGNGAAGIGTFGTSPSGGGGGGAGGLIVMRTESGTITNATLAAAGGTPGAGDDGGATGGQGGAGRIRVDAPGALPATTPTGVLHRGLSFASATSRVSTTDNPMVTLIGTAGDVFDMYVIDAAGVEHNGEPQNQTIEASGMKTVIVTLLPGYNKLCATLRPGTRNASDPFTLTDKCVEIAYLP